MNRLNHDTFLSLSQAEPVFLMQMSMSLSCMLLFVVKDCCLFC